MFEGTSDFKATRTCFGQSTVSCLSLLTLLSYLLSVYTEITAHGTGAVDVPSALRSAEIETRDVALRCVSALLNAIP